MILKTSLKKYNYRYQQTINLSSKISLKTLKSPKNFFNKIYNRNSVNENPIFILSLIKEISWCPPALKSCTKTFVHHCIPSYLIIKRGDRSRDMVLRATTQSHLNVCGSRPSSTGCSHIHSISPCSQHTSGRCK